MQTETLDPAKPLLRKYKGDGSQIAIAEQCNKGFAGTIVLTSIFLPIAWLCVTLGFSILAARVLEPPFITASDAAGEIVIASMSLGLIIYTLAVVKSLYPYLKARRKFLATKQEAEYWLANTELRFACRKPRTADEFKALIYAAEALDAQKYREHVRVEMRKTFVQLRRERGFQVDAEMLEKLDALTTQP